MKLRKGVFRLLMQVLPDGLFYADRLTVSARRLVVRLAIGVVAVVILAVASALLRSSTNWADVLSGAGMAWGVSIGVWAVGSYRRSRQEIETDLRRVAEFDLLHHRLNQAGPVLGIPRVDIEAGVEDILSARMERLAHFAGLDEFRRDASVDGYEFWAR